MTLTFQGGDAKLAQTAQPSPSRMHVHIRNRNTTQNGEAKTNNDKFVPPPQRQPLKHPHFAPLRLPISMALAPAKSVLTFRPTPTNSSCPLVSQRTYYLSGIFLLLMCNSIVMAGTLAWSPAYHSSSSYTSYCQHGCSNK